MAQSMIPWCCACIGAQAAGGASVLLPSIGKRKTKVCSQKDLQVRVYTILSIGNFFHCSVTRSMHHYNNNSYLVT